MPDFTLPFTSPEATLTVVGGKGANLSRLTRAGFPVPPGFLITTAAYHSFVEANDLQARILRLATDPRKSSEQVSIIVRQLFDLGYIPHEVTSAIRHAQAELLRAGGGSSLAVRALQLSGGPFSHTAIVAREFGIPLVNGAIEATQVIVDRNSIVVDA